MDDWIAPEWPAPAKIIAGTTLRSRPVGDLPIVAKPAWLTQVHGSDVVVADVFKEPPAADASTNGDAGVACVVRTADCLPVLFCSQDGSRFGAAHAGWRGLAAGVLENTVAALDVAASELLVWFGPAISQAAFEVGDEVREVFLQFDAGAEVCFERNPRGRWQADLYGLARRRLAALGVTNTFGGDFCTYQDQQRFYSYRRNPECGRLLSFVARRSP